MFTINIFVIKEYFLGWGFRDGPLLYLFCVVLLFLLKY